MSKVFPSYIIVVLNQDICVNIVNFFKLIPLIHPSTYANCSVDLGTHPTRKLEYHNESIKHKQSVEKFNNAKITELTISKKKLT